MRRRTILVLIAILVLPSVLVGCCTFLGVGLVRGSGRIISETRRVRDFDRVSLSGSGEVIITQTGEESLTIEADDNIMEYVRADVRGDTLILGFNNKARNKSISTKQPIKFILSVKNVTDLECSGSGSILAAPLKADRLDLSVSGSGEIMIESLHADMLDVDISGSGKVKVAGTVPKQRIDISGSGEYIAPDLESDAANVEVSGSGRAVVWAHDTLDVTVSGSGDVEYYGRPKVSEKVSGSGSVRALGAH